MRKRFENAVSGAIGALFILALVVATAVVAQSPNGIRGAFAGNLQLPAPFTLTFGTGALSSDVALGKNGANVVGVTGDIGGSGATANTTTSPAGPFAWGTVALSGGAATVTFKTPFANAPVCTANDQTAANAVKTAPTATTLVLAGTTTDVIAYHCLGNPN